MRHVAASAAPLTLHDFPSAPPPVSVPCKQPSRLLREAVYAPGHMAAAPASHAPHKLPAATWSLRRRPGLETGNTCCRGVPREIGRPAGIVSNASPALVLPLGSPPAVHPAFGKQREERRV